MFEIGSALFETRERQRIGLDQAEAETKIRARYLRALEEEDFGLLPGPTFVKGFLRTYADYLGLDGRLFVDEYNSRYSDPFGEESPFARRRPLPRDRHRQRRQSSAVLVALAGIVAVSILVIVGTRYPAGREDAPPPAPSTMAIEPPGNPRIDPEDAAGPAPLTDGDESKPATPVKLTVRATEPVWVAVWRGRDQDAPARFEGSLDPTGPGPDATRRFTSRVGFTIEVGDATAVVLRLNGRDVRLPGAGQRYFIAPDAARTITRLA